MQQRIVRASQRVPKRKRHEEGTRRLGLLGMLAHHADRRSGDAFGLERTGQHTTGVCAEGSRRSDKGRVDTVFAQPPSHLGPGLLLDAREIALGAHE